MTQKDKTEPECVRGGIQSSYTNRNNSTTIPLDHGKSQSMFKDKENARKGGLIEMWAQPSAIYQKGTMGAEKQLNSGDM